MKMSAPNNPLNTIAVSSDDASGVVITIENEDAHYETITATFVLTESQADALSKDLSYKASHARAVAR